MEKLDAFTRAYIDCAFWCESDNSTEQGGEPFDRNYGIEDLAPETLKRMVEDCADFQRANAVLLEQAYASPDYGRGGYTGEEYAGHDFWLTRNRHGAGFWDRGLGEVGRALTEMAHGCGEVHLYVGDDKKIYARNSRP